MHGTILQLIMHHADHSIYKQYLNINIFKYIFMHHFSPTLVKRKVSKVYMGM